MSASAIAPGRAGFWWSVRIWSPLCLLLAATLALGVAGVGAARLVFIGGCVVVAWDLTRVGAAAHYSACLILFCLAPFLRRVVDLNAGYEASGLMIAGPLLALLTPTPLLLRELGQGKLDDPALRPFVLGLLCPFWGLLLTVFDGSLSQAMSGALKWMPPVVYGIWLYRETQGTTAAIDLLARTFLVLTPLMGLYGLVQYVDPPMWDRYWMTYTEIASIGQPEPYQVRVFSVLNAPAGYAGFTAAGLLLFGFRRLSLGLLLAAGPSVLGLLLSMYRTAWIALGFGIVIGLFHPRSMRRAALLLVAVPILGAAVVAFTPAGEALQDRLATFSAIGADASGQERLAEYGALLNADGGTLVGHGFSTVDVLQAGTMALDGEFIVAWFTFGLVVGLVTVAAVVWAAAQGMRGAWREGSLSGMAVAAILAGALVQLPLATISSSETGFLVWSLAGIGAAMGRPRPRRPARASPSTALALVPPVTAGR